MLRKKVQIKAVREKIGQSTVEYIILVAAVVAVMILFLAPNGIFQNALNQTLVDGTNSIMNMAERLKNSAPLAQ